MTSLLRALPEPRLVRALVRALVRSLVKGATSARELRLELEGAQARAL
jgi:hypothetical protein